MRNKSDNTNCEVVGYKKLPTPNSMYRNYLLDRLLPKLNLPKDIFFLEIGCGTGKFLLKMSALGYKGWGIDISEQSIEIARKRLSGTKIEVFNKDMMSLTSTFDMAFSFEVLEHIENDVDAMIKVNQLLNNKGYYMLSVPGRKDLFNETDKALGHVRRYEKEELVEKLEQADFEILNLWSWGLPLFSKIRNVAVKREKRENCNLCDKTKRSGYASPTTQLIRWLYPVYSRLFALLKLQNLFLHSDWLNCNYLVLCQKRDYKAVKETVNNETNG